METTFLIMSRLSANRSLAVLIAIIKVKPIIIMVSVIPRLIKY